MFCCYGGALRATLFKNEDRLHGTRTKFVRVHTRTTMSSNDPLQQTILALEAVDRNDASLLYSLCENAGDLPCPAGDPMQHPLAVAILKEYRSCVQTLVSFPDILPEGLIITLLCDSRTAPFLNDCLWSSAMVCSIMNGDDMTGDDSSVRRLCESWGVM